MQYMMAIFMLNYLICYTTFGAKCNHFDHSNIDDNGHKSLQSTKLRHRDTIKKNTCCDLVFFL